MVILGIKLLITKNNTTMKNKKRRQRIKWVVESPNPSGYKLYIAVYQIYDEPAEVRVLTAKSLEEAKKNFRKNWWIVEIDRPEDLIRYGCFLDLYSVGNPEDPYGWKSTGW